MLIDLRTGRLTTISFNSSVLGLAQKTLVSKRINTPFTTKELIVNFALNTNRLLKIRPFISYDNNAPTDTQPKATNILTQLSQSDFLVGDDEQKRVSIEIKQDTSGVYILIHAENDDVVEHTIDVQVIIELLPRENDEVEEQDK